jgi:hypothetical protein
MQDRWILQCCSRFFRCVDGGAERPDFLFIDQFQQPLPDGSAEQIVMLPTMQKEGRECSNPQGLARTAYALIDRLA